MTTPRWPYPDLLAHRGGGRLAPENTLSALVAGALFGSRMAEFDVRLSRDNVPFLLHDDKLERTTNGNFYGYVEQVLQSGKVVAGDLHRFIAL